MRNYRSRHIEAGFQIQFDFAIPLLFGQAVEISEKFFRAYLDHAGVVYQNVDLAKMLGNFADQICGGCEVPQIADGSEDAVRSKFRRTIMNAVCG